MYGLSFAVYNNGVRKYQAFDALVESFNAMAKPSRHIYINCGNAQITAEESRSLFSHIDILSANIAAASTVNDASPILMERAVAYSMVQDFEAALNDLTVCLQADSTNVLAYWQRAVCQSMLNNYDASRGIDTRLTTAKAESDFNDALKLAPTNAYIYYDRGNLYASRKDYAKAVDDYTRAIELDPNLAEAYYNRGLTRIRANNRTQGIADLSKAGELGLYGAYSLIKQYSADKNK